MRTTIAIAALFAAANAGMSVTEAQVKDTTKDNCETIYATFNSEDIEHSAGCIQGGTCSTADAPIVKAIEANINAGACKDSCQFIVKAVLPITAKLQVLGKCAEKENDATCNEIKATAEKWTQYKTDAGGCADVTPSGGKDGESSDSKTDGAFTVSVVASSIAATALLI